MVFMDWKYRFRQRERLRLPMISSIEIVFTVFTYHKIPTMKVISFGSPNRSKIQINLINRHGRADRAECDRENNIISKTDSNMETW